ncbi:uncharacterized protein CBL_14626 [Carabus blaptoides fortunei]
MELEFCDLSYKVKSYFNLFGQTKTILHNVNGTFKPGQFCGILGPSGAGKSTLLHALSGYRTNGVSGHININGNRKKNTDFRRRFCYITQEDQLPPFMTVKEAMIMAANLKLPRTTDFQTKMKTISEILLYLGLEEQSKTNTEHLSGGQKKRLSVALELLNNPPMFFLDEPTSGLDNVSMKYCLKLLQSLAREGRTIVCTIHQPPASLLPMFDHIYVVARGMCVYQGHPNDLVSFLSNSGYVCPESNNPADYIIELVDLDPNAASTLSKLIENGKILYRSLEDNYPKANASLSKDSAPRNFETLDSNTAITSARKSSMRKSSLFRNYEENSHISVRRKSSEAHTESFLKRDSILKTFQWIKLNQSVDGTKANYANSGWYQFLILLRRLVVHNVRNRYALVIQAVHYIICAVTLGIVYYDQADNGAFMFQHLKFTLGFVLFYSHTRLFVPIILFPPEIKIAKKEHFNGWYSLFPYFCAYMIAGLPAQLIFNMLHMSIVYYLSGLPQELWRFLLFVLISNAVAFSSEGIGIAIGATFNALNGSVLGPSLTAPYLCLAVYGADFMKQISYFMQILQLSTMAVNQ